MYIYDYGLMNKQLLKNIIYLDDQNRYFSFFDCYRNVYMYVFNNCKY